MVDSRLSTKLVAQFLGLSYAATGANRAAVDEGIANNPNVGTAKAAAE